MKVVLWPAYPRQVTGMSTKMFIIKVRRVSTTMNEIKHVDLLFLFRKYEWGSEQEIIHAKDMYN